MIGIYLQGGGAKGAYQAGAIYALHEMHVQFDVAAGTSIGAINGYYIYTGQYEALKQMWIDVDASELSYIKESDNIIENAFLMDKLKQVKCCSLELKSFYVNYVEVKDCKLVQVYDNLMDLNIDEALERIRYSSLLPKPKGVKLDRESLEAFDSKYLFEKFKEELVKGEYNDMSLDGGILNNHFLEPFEEEHVNQLILIPFQPNYVVPDYISKKYSAEQIVVIDPVEAFLPMDTLRFEPEFCKHQFFEGYRRAKEVWMQVKNK